MYKIFCAYTTWVKDRLSFIKVHVSQHLDRFQTCLTLLSGMFGQASLHFKTTNRSKKMWSYKQVVLK